MRCPPLLTGIRFLFSAVVTIITGIWKNIVLPVLSFTGTFIAGACFAGLLVAGVFFQGLGDKRSASEKRFTGQKQDRLHSP
jgi:hypothetical protein